MKSYPTYKLVTTLKDLRQQLHASGKVIGFDTETTGLYADTARVRLAQLYNDDVAIIVDCFQLRGGFKALARELQSHTLAVFYAGFEQQWFDQAGVKVRLWDVGHMRRSVMGGGPLSLKMQAKFDLDIEMDKTQQSSNWAAPELSKEQLDYAFVDAIITWRLYELWEGRMHAGHWSAFAAFNDMTPVTMEMAQTGIRLDVKRHADLTKIWFNQRLVAEINLRKVVPPEAVCNLNSDAQWSDMFSQQLPDTFLRGWPRTEKTGQLSMKNDNLKHMASHLDPDHDLSKLFYLMVEYKYLGKYLSSFGESLIAKAGSAKDGRIRARFNVGAARTGRMSSSGPNVQQIPRDNENFSVRQSFIAGPRRVLASYDYSGIEMRVLAELSGDEALLYDCIYGDVHLEVASQIAGKQLKRPDDDGLRQGAKAVNFGIIYGSGAAGLAATTRQSTTASKRMIKAWKKRYPKAYNIRFDWERQAKATGYLTTQLGGTIYVGKQASLPVCANYPVQRAAAEVMYKACARHKASLDGLRTTKTYASVKLLATIHDCLIDECSRSVAPRVLRVMKQDMTAGFLDVFPNANTDNLVDGGSGPSWGDLS